jgi:CHAT domain-containing protein
MWRRPLAWLLASLIAAPGAALAGAPTPPDPPPPNDGTARGLLVASRARSRAGQYDEAIDLAKQALAQWEKEIGPSAPGLVDPLDHLASLLAIKGDDDGAQRLRLRAMAILEAEHGADDPQLVADLLALARLYHAHGDDRRAEPLLTRAVAIAEGAWKDRPQLLTEPLRAAAAFYQDQGDDERAEPLLVRQLALAEAYTEPDHIFTTTPMISLGAFYRRRGDLARARPLLEKANAIFTADPYWRDHFHEVYLRSFVELGALYADAGEDERAAPLLEKALDLSERSMGPESPVAARCQNDLGALRLQQGDPARALPLLQKALAAREKVLGKGSLEVAETLGHLGDLHQDTGDRAAAVGARRRAATIRDYHAQLVLAGGSEQRRRLYMATVQADTAAVVSLHTRAAPASAEAAELALLTILRRKGRVLDAMADSFAALRLHVTPAARALLDELAAIDLQLSARISRGPGETPAPVHAARIEDLDRRREEIEARVAEESASFRAEQRPISLDQVRSAIPEGEALIELSRAPTYLGAAHRRPAERWGEARYVAYVLRRDGPVRWADLGPARAIDDRAETLRRALADPTSDPRPAARALDLAVMQPLRAILGGTTRLLLSPDGALSLVPFGALADEAGHYRIERLSFTYLTSGRDLVWLQAASRPRQGPVVMANPAFGDLDEVAAGSSSGRGVRSVDLSNAFFRPLPGTAREGVAVSSAIAGAALWMGEQATEAALKGAHAPSILHVATHGFFLPDEAAARAEGAAPPAITTAPPRENPLLRAGLALAGANARKSGTDDDGVLTALEASALDLDGTELVVLSACETGLGKAIASEGVFGLRRALRMAGAKALVMSLWRVDDAATYALMVAYYERLLAGGGRSAALREAALGLLADKRTSHPFYWAGFIASGAEGPIPGDGFLPKVPPGPRGCACRSGGGAGGGHGVSGAALFALCFGAAVVRRRRRAGQSR